MPTQKEMEQKVLKAVRNARKPAEPLKIVQVVAKDNDQDQVKAAREAIRSLVDKGTLQVTIDWKVKTAKAK